MANRSRCPWTECQELHERVKAHAIYCSKADAIFTTNKGAIVSRTKDGFWRTDFPTGKHQANAFDGTMSRANHKRDIYKGAGSTPKPGRRSRDRARSVDPGTAAILSILRAK